MARVNLPPTVITRSGVAPATEVAGDATNFHSFANANSDVILLVRNADTSTHVLTIRFSETVDGQAVTSRAITMPVSTSRYFGPFPRGEYGATVLVDVDSSQLKLSTYKVSL